MTILEELAFVMCRAAASCEALPFSYEAPAIAEKQAFYVMRKTLEAMLDLRYRTDIMEVCGPYDTEFYEAWPRVVQFILNEKSK